MDHVNIIISEVQ